MKRFTRNSAIFIFSSIIIYCIIVFFAKKTAAVYKDGAAVICEQKRKAVRKNLFPSSPDRQNILFMGNSVTLAGLLPEYFDSLNGGKSLSYNLSLPALPLGPQYFMLKDYLRNNKAPDYIIIYPVFDYGDTRNFFDKYAIQGIKFPQEIISYLLHRDNKVVVMNYVFPMNLYNVHMIRYLFYLLKEPGAIAEKKAYNQLITSLMVKSKGYYFIREQAAFPGDRLPDQYRQAKDSNMAPYDYDPDKDYYAKIFFDLAKEKNIKVLMIQKYARHYTTAQYDKEPVYFSKIAARYPNVKYVKGAYKIRFMENRYFADPTHLNPEGARIYTNEVFRQFREIYP